MEGRKKWRKVGGRTGCLGKINEMMKEEKEVYERAIEGNFLEG